ncbi:hypothetical protein SFR_4358 [Streptomyces sp. FR-008]|nr:hypothetical protein SFR_4358 [Streptomyces sp. FR-008]
MRPAEGQRGESVRVLRPGVEHDPPPGPPGRVTEG